METRAQKGIYFGEFMHPCSRSCRGTLLNTPGCRLEAVNLTIQQPFACIFQKLLAKRCQVITMSCLAGLVHAPVPWLQGLDLTYRSKEVCRVQPNWECMRLNLLGALDTSGAWLQPHPNSSRLHMTICYGWTREIHTKTRGKYLNTNTCSMQHLWIHTGDPHQDA